MPRPGSGQQDRHLDALKRALAHHAAGHRPAALAELDRILRSDARHHGAHRIAAVVHLAALDLDRALYHAEKAVAIAPGASPNHTLLGSVLDARGDTEGAIESMRRATEVNPGDADAITTLANTLDSLGRLDEALAQHERALRVSPNHAAAGINAALSMLTAGRTREAVDLCERLAGLHPRDPRVAERLAFCLNYDDRATRASVNAAHRRFGALLEASVTPLPARPRVGGGRVRLGVLSPDLRRHSVASFLDVLFDHLDRERFELVAYFTSSNADAVTQGFRARADGWRDAPGLSPSALAAQIRGDEVDVLVELSGLFARHRLATLAQRPAPVQITWLGYPNTTGLTRLDARFVDSLTDPVEITDALPPGAREAERLARLDPCFLCYSPPEAAPPPRAPADASGDADRPFTFVSFNDIKKVSPTTIDLWSAVLGRVPGSRLALKAGPLAAEGVRRGLAAAFAARGVGADRLELERHTSDFAEHLAAYHRADLALDTFPYHGTTTTCEALWMGVPVVTRVGQTHAARVGLSILSAVGLPQLATRTAEEYIDLAAALAADPARLASLRDGLRDRVAASVLTDAGAFADRFARAVLSLL